MALSEPQIDFILEMYARDHPKEFEFHRLGNEPKPPESETLAAWERVLIGQTRHGMFSRMLPSLAVLKRAGAVRDTAADLAKLAGKASKEKK